MKLSGYCFYMNTNIQGDSQIYISVPLNLASVINCEGTRFSKNQSQIFSGCLQISMQNNFR